MRPIWIMNHFYKNTTSDNTNGYNIRNYTIPEHYVNIIFNLITIY